MSAGSCANFCAVREMYARRACLVCEPECVDVELCFEDVGDSGGVSCDHENE